MIWDFLGWLAFILNVWGNLMLTTKGVSGWIIRLACNVCWLPYAVHTGAWALLWNHLLFMGINAYGWWKWSRGGAAPSERMKWWPKYSLRCALGFHHMIRVYWRDGFACVRCPAAIDCTPPPPPTSTKGESSISN